MIGVCRQGKIFLKRQHMRDAVNNVGPVRRALRKCVQCPGPNFIMAKSASVHRDVM